MKKILLFILLFASCLALGESGPPPKFKRTSGSAIINKAADSVGIVDTTNGDTIWFVVAGIEMRGNSITGASVFKTNGAVGTNLELKSSHATTTQSLILNTATGSAIIVFDAINGDTIGSDFGSIGQMNVSNMRYDVGGSADSAYHSFTVGATE